MKLERQILLLIGACGTHAFLEGVSKVLWELSGAFPLNDPSGDVIARTAASLDRAKEESRSLPKAALEQSAAKNNGIEISEALNCLQMAEEYLREGDMDLIADLIVPIHSLVLRKHSGKFDDVMKCFDNMIAALKGEAE